MALISRTSLKAAIFTLIICIPASAPVFAASPRGDVAFGEYLAGECVTCHQKSGKVVGGVPAIIGWPEDQFLVVMDAYRQKDRENEVMRTIAGKFKDDELAALAAYFGSLKPQK